MRRGPSLAARALLAAIRAYQRWISPHKGFCCALRTATGGASCSAYGYDVVARYGLHRGLGLLDRRLALCGHAHRQWKAAPAPTPPHPRFHRQRGHCDVPSCDAGFDVLDIATCAADAWDCDRSCGCLSERFRRRRPDSEPERLRADARLHAIRLRAERARH